ncbi:hypothetical protein ACFU90_37995 [Streptomyces noursei]|uniref:hypothetical protein n=1 Tax=Streptomyces noursei TaxID=1971 RepID=UPI0036B9D86A
MPVDVFAALSALVRAEARRTAPRPQPHPPTPSAPADEPGPPGPAAPVPPQHATPPARPHPQPTAPTPLRAASSSAPEADLSAAGPPRPGLLRKLLALVAAWVRRRRNGSAERRPAPES